MKGTLKDQLMAAVESGKIVTSKTDRKANGPMPASRACPKLKADLQNRDVLFFKRLAIEGRNQSLISMECPKGIGDIQRFLIGVYDAKKTNAISDVDHFFCLAAFARLKPSDCRKDWYFRQRLTLAAKNIYIKKRTKQSLSEKDADDFKRVFKTVHSFINDDELDSLLENYDKRRAQEKYARKQAEIAKKCSEIERRLSVYDFERAERLYQRYKDVVIHAIYQKLVRKYEGKQADEKLLQINRFLDKFDFETAEKAYLQFARIIPREKYENLKLSYQEKYSLKMLDEIIMPHLRRFKFSTAAMLYAQHSDIIRPKHYEKAKAEALVNELLNKILKSLQEGDYAVADELAEMHPQFPKEQYLALKVGFVSHSLSLMGKSRFTPVAVKEFSEKIVREDPALANSLNSQTRLYK